MLGDRVQKSLCHQEQELVEEGLLIGWGSGWTLEGGQEIQERVISRCVWRVGRRPNGWSSWQRCVVRGKIESWIWATWGGVELWPKEVELELVGKRQLWKM